MLTMVFSVFVGVWVFAGGCQESVFLPQKARSLNEVSPLSDLGQEFPCRPVKQ